MSIFATTSSVLWQHLRMAVQQGQDIDELAPVAQQLPYLAFRPASLAIRAQLPLVQVRYCWEGLHKEALRKHPVLGSVNLQRPGLIPACCLAIRSKTLQTAGYGLFDKPQHGFYGDLPCPLLLVPPASLQVGPKQVLAADSAYTCKEHWNRIKQPVIS